MLARLQGLTNLSCLTPQCFLSLLFTIAFAEPRTPLGRRLVQEECAHQCLALRSALHLLSLALHRQAELHDDMAQMHEQPWRGPKASSAPGCMQAACNKVVMDFGQVTLARKSVPGNFPLQL